MQPASVICNPSCWVYPKGEGTNTLGQLYCSTGLGNWPSVGQYLNQTGHWARVACSGRRLIIPYLQSQERVIWKNKFRLTLAGVSCRRALDGKTGKEEHVQRGTYQVVLTSVHFQFDSYAPSKGNGDYNLLATVIATNIMRRNWQANIQKSGVYASLVYKFVIFLLFQ